MNSKLFSFLFLFLFCIIFLNVNTFAEGEGDKNSRTVNKVNGQPIRSLFNINNISTVFKNDGISDIDRQEANSGLVYPKGSGKTAVFTSGFLWGARITGDPQVRVGGTAYRTGLQGGKITNSNLPWDQLTSEDPGADHVRIYRVRPDVIPESGPRPANYTAGDVSAEVTDNEGSASVIIDQYELDWIQWPGDEGAPYNDVNGNGVYDASTDIPGVPGANQTIWFVANDLNQGRANNLYGADPLGIEMQATIWGYAQTGALGNMLFRRYKIINKSSDTFNDMYVSMFSDVDLGNASDDFAGCDTTLSLGFCYNAGGNDATYNPLPPPAVGFDFFQGPVLAGIAGEDKNKNGVDDAEDFGIFNGRVVGPGQINLPMTSFYYFARGDASVTDPTQGDPQGSNQFYNFFQGRIGLSGNLFVDPNTGETTTYALSGDVQTRQGWIDGQLIGGGDRRIGSASGPFQMSPGDTQEVVVAEIVAGALPGVDRISAVGLLKFYDQAAQVAYDNFFDLPTAPPAPIVTVTELDKEIVLDWSKNNNRVIETETNENKGYKFQGYNVYQLPSASSSISEGVRVATYDITDGLGRIFDQVFDPNTGSVVVLPVQFGNETGLKRFVSITQDALNQRPLINGIRYYFAVTAYNFNPDPLAVPNNLENPISILTVVPHTNDPGVTYGEGNGEGPDIIHNGTADGSVTATIVDPAATTGDSYEVFFSTQAQIRNENGDWVPASEIVLGKPSNPDSLNLSTIDIAAVYGADGNSVDLLFHLEVIHHAGGWADGVTLTFPAGVQILAAPSFDAGGGTVDPEIVGNVINMGLINHELTQDGIFHNGGENWVVTVAPGFDLPVSVDWVVYDDGYPSDPLDATGTTTVTEIGFATRVAELWNLENTTTGTLLLQNQSIYNGIERWPRRDGLSPLEINIGPDAMPVIDGFQIDVNVGFAAPTTISANNAPTVNGTALSLSGGQWSNDDYILNDFIFFGYADGKAVTSLGPAGYAPGAGGTNDVNKLQQDYELRFTGVLADTVINGITIEYTQSGGSMATLLGASGYALADHPFNPTGAEAPFTIRIPFEVWNVDNNEQVKLIIWDRSGNPTVDGGKVWNTDNRVYLWVVNSAYNTNVIDPLSQDFNENATWNWVLYQSTFTRGDIFRINYDNPIQIGTDTYSFSTTEAAFSSELAKDEVAKINVFPNPYYGVNSEELNKYNRFVTFSHLPDKATIRIFNLAGILVRTILKDDATTQFQRWDLANDSGLPVASGLYIAYIDMPDLGSTKILKVAIIQEQQILDRF